MSGLKSAWELSLERSDKLVPELKKQKKLTKKQKDEIAEIRVDCKVKIADKEVTLEGKLKKIADRTPPEEIPLVTEELQNQFADDKKSLEEERDARIEAVRDRSK